MESKRAASNRERRPSSSGYTRILFVDDEACVRSAFARSVRSHGFLVDTAATADEALSLAREVSYPVIATDLSLTKTDGLSLIRKIADRDPNTVFVIITGLADIEVPNEPHLQDSVVSIIRKPWDADELIDTLHRAVRLSGARASRCAPIPGNGRAAERVLLVEDSDADAALISAYLAQSPLDVELIRGRRLSDALSMLETERFDIIIADLGLPDARGLDAVLRIQNVASDAPLIVMSGLNDDAVAMEAVQAGAQDYLVKGSVDGPGLARSIRHAQERKRSQHSLTRLAHFDPLTGLANRTQFKQRLEHTLSRAKRTAEPFAVLFVDLDHLKPINDKLGHAAGDAVLVEASRRLEGTVREYDTVARLGGDEFAIILDNLSDASEVAAVAKRLLEAVSRPYKIGDANPSLTASVGIAFYPDAGSTPQELLKAADSAMYAAKNGGRNTYEVSQPEGAPSQVPLLEVCAELKRALRNDEFELHYQPQFDVRTGRIAAAEALLRWRRKGRTLVMPGEFLPLLEDSGEIRRVGAWAIKTACADLQRGKREAVSISRVSVNVSVHQLDGHELVHVVRRALDETQIDPSALELEITESSVMHNPRHALSLLTQLKDLGIRISMDDFGTGHSSLSYLYRLPIDTVKIDRSFVRDSCSSEQCRSVTRGIIAMAKQIGLEIVAEGVENQQQRIFLENEGCDVLQGYFFGRPMPSGQLLDHIQTCDITPTLLAGNTHYLGRRRLAPVPEGRKAWKIAK